MTSDVRAVHRGGRESGARLNGEGWQPVQGKTGGRIPYQVRNTHGGRKTT